MSLKSDPDMGINSWLEDELYQQYLHDRTAVDDEWKHLFEGNGGQTQSYTTVYYPADSSGGAWYEVYDSQGGWIGSGEGTPPADDAVGTTTQTTDQNHNTAIFPSDSEHSNTNSDSDKKDGDKKNSDQNNDQDGDGIRFRMRFPVQGLPVEARDDLAKLVVHLLEARPNRACHRRRHRLVGLGHHVFSVTRYSRYRPSSRRVCASSAGRTLSTSPTTG